MIAGRTEFTGEPEGAEPTTTALGALFTDEPQSPFGATCATIV